MSGSVGPLQKNIIQALGNADWTVINILHIDDERSNQRIGLGFDYPVTLLIPVRDGSMSWDRAYAVLARCHRILQRHGLEMSRLR